MCTIAKIIWSRQGHEGYFPLPHAKAVGTILYMMTSDYRGSYTCVSGPPSVVCTLHIAAHAQVAKGVFFPMHSCFACLCELCYKGGTGQQHGGSGREGQRGMDSGDLHALDARISALEAELQRLKTQGLTHLGRQPRPLDVIRVFDLSRLIFGPFCTQILADMGADVIKVEPHTGDQARRSGTVFVNGESASFLARNRNKRSLTLDLRQPAAREIAHRLVQRSDILVHNFRPGVMARLGLDAKQVHALNPRVVYCSLTGDGQRGPRADWPGQDLLIQAMSGIISTTGWEDGPPVTVGTYIAAMTGALKGVQ